MKVGSSEPNRNVRQTFENIARNQPPAGLDENRFGLQYAGEGGRIIRIPGLCDCPQPFRSFLEGVERELNDIARRTILTIRWRSNARGPHSPFGWRGLYWSFDSQFWHPAPPQITVQVDEFTPMDASREMVTDSHRTVSEGRSEPLHHDLFREAWDQRFSNPRSALVIGIAAAETAVKHCISTLVPAAEWLATSIPSPPLVTILSEYVPNLPVRYTIAGAAKAPPDAVKNSLIKGIMLRNKVSHGRGSPPSAETTEEILEAVRDVLWLIDYYCGAEWALTFVRESTRAQLMQG